MKTPKILSIAFMAAALFATTSTIAQETEMEEEEIIEVEEDDYDKINIVEFASASEDHTTLVAALKAAGLVETLSGDGPFTVFAPVNSAFDALPEGTVATLLKPENKSKLAGVLTYHVVVGKVNAADVLALINDNNGKATVPTISGGLLTFTANDGNVYVSDASGNTATVTVADLDQSNGVIHVIDTVLLPK